jgi:integrase
VGRSAAGKPHYKDFIGQTEEEVRAKHAAYVAANPNGPPTADQTQLLERFLFTYLAAGDWAASTKEDRVRTVKKHIAPRIGKTPLNELNAPQIAKWMKELREAGVGGRTVEKAHAILRAALSQAEEWGIIANNPAKKARPPRYTRRKAQYLDIAQVEKLLAAAAGELDKRGTYTTRNYTTAAGVKKPGRTKSYPPIETRLYMLYLLYVVVGPRRGEPLALRWSDYDPKSGALTIERSMDARGRVGPTKTESGVRTIYLDEYMRAELQRHRELMQAEEHREGWKPDGLIFPSEAGTPLGPRNLLRHFKKVLAAAGLPLSLRIHDLRHSSASIALAEGGDIVDVSRVLGHSSAVITQKLYAHALDEGQKRAVAGVSRRIAQKRPSKE